MCWCQLWKVCHHWNDGLFINLGCLCSRKTLLKLALLAVVLFGRAENLQQPECTAQDQSTHPLLGGGVCVSLVYRFWQRIGLKCCSHSELLEEELHGTGCTPLTTQPGNRLPSTAFQSHAMCRIRSNHGWSQSDGKRTVPKKQIVCFES